MDFGTVKELLLSAGGVAVSQLHMWSLNMDCSLLSAHVALGRVNQGIDLTSQLTDKSSN